MGFVFERVLVEMIIKLNQRIVKGLGMCCVGFFEFDVETTGCQSNVTLAIFGRCVFCNF